MKELLSVNELYRAVGGEQALRPGGYMLSRYCLRVPCEDGELFYHNLTGRLLLLSREEADALDARFAERGAAEVRQTEDALFAVLVKQWFFVPVGTNERELADQAMQTARLLERWKPCIKDFTIFTTTDCNARCYYCYELGRRRVAMSEQTAHDAAAYIRRVCDGNAVSIRWFGGEPLCNAAAIDIISDDLAAGGVEFTSRIVSNGYLFDEDMVARAVDRWKLRSAQIPLDGTEDVYNRNKAFIYKDGSAYERVMKNIERLLDAEVRVALRLNVDQRNAEDVDRLADELIARFHGRKGVEAYAALLQDFGHAINCFESDDAALAVYDALQKKLIAAGIGKVDYPRRKISLNMCMADNDRAMTILPDGRLGKCQHRVDADPVGSIYDEQMDTDMIAAWKDAIRIDACEDCLMYPYCIRLKKCPWTKGVCAPFNRKISKLNLTQKVLNCYEAYKRSAT